MPMSQLRELLARYKNVILFVFALQLVALVAFIEIKPANDLFWHLRMGRDLLEHGLTPFRDHYSFTFPDAPIKWVAWVFQVTSYACYKFLGGALGIQILVAISQLSILLLFLRMCIQRAVPIQLIVFGLLGIATALRMRSEPRPETLGNIFTMILVYYYYVVSGQWHKRDLFKIIAILALWSNVHSSSIIGYVIAGSLYLQWAFELILEAAPIRGWANWAGFGIVTFLVGFLNPDLSHVVLEIFSFGDKWNQYIKEFDALAFGQAPYVIKICLILLPVISFQLFRRRQVGLLFLLAILVWKMFESSRLATTFLIVGLPIYVLTFAEIYHEIVSKQLGRHAKKIAIAVLILNVIVALQFYKSTIFKANYSARIDSGEGLEKIMDHMEAHHLEGNIVPSYGAGGYILYRMSVGSRVAIDGRTNILYPFDFVKNYSEKLSSVSELNNFLAPYRVDYIVAENANENYLILPALQSGRFSIEMATPQYLLLSAKRSAFPVLSKIAAFPQCLQNSDRDAVGAEVKMAASVFQEKSPMGSVLLILDRYFQDAKGLLDSPPKVDSAVYGNSVNRVLMYLALREKNFMKAIEFADRLNLPTRSDRLTAARAMCEARDCVGAAEMLDFFPPNGMQDFELYDAYQILLEIDKRRPSALFPRARIEKTKMRLSKYLESGTVPERPESCPIVKH